MEIPDKLFFKIGEVCEIAGVEPYVLRFWESEFPSLAPKKSESGHRVYRKKDVEMVLQIKELLYQRGFTIAGARKQLSRHSDNGDAGADAQKVLADVCRELRQILDLLKRR